MSDHLFHLAKAAQDQKVRIPADLAKKPSGDRQFCMPRLRVLCFRIHWTQGRYMATLRGEHAVHNAKKHVQNRRCLHSCHLVSRDLRGFRCSREFLVEGARRCCLLCLDAFHSPSKSTLLETPFPEDIGGTASPPLSRHFSIDHPHKKAGTQNRTCRRDENRRQQGGPERQVLRYHSSKRKGKRSQLHVLASARAPERAIGPLPLSLSVRTAHLAVRLTCRTCPPAPSFVSALQHRRGMWGARRKKGRRNGQNKDRKTPALAEQASRP